MSKLKYLVPKQELFSKLQQYSEAKLAQMTKYSQDQLTQIQKEKSDIEAEYAKQQQTLEINRELEISKAQEDWNKDIKHISDLMAQTQDACKSGEKYISSLQNKTGELFETYQNEVSQTYSSMGNHLKIAINAIFEVKNEPLTQKFAKTLNICKEMFDKAEKIAKSALDAKCESAEQNIEKIKAVLADMSEIRQLEDSYHQEFLKVVSGYSSADILKKYFAIENENRAKYYDKLDILTNEEHKLGTNIITTNGELKQHKIAMGAMLNELNAYKVENLNLDYLLKYASYNSYSKEFQNTVNEVVNSMKSNIDSNGVIAQNDWPSFSVSVDVCTITDPDQVVIGETVTRSGDGCVLI